MLITRYEDPCAVLLSVQEYERLVSATQPSLEQLSTEQREEHAELRELLDALRIGEHGDWNVGTDDETGEQVAEDARLPEQSGQHGRHPGNAEHDREIDDEVPLGHAVF